MPSECQGLFPEKPFLFMLALWPILWPCQQLFFFFPQNEMFYKDLRWTMFPGPLRPIASFSEQLYWERCSTSGRCIRNADYGVWWMDRVSMQNKRHPILWAHTGRVEHWWVQSHSSSPQGSVGQWSLHSPWPCFYMAALSTWRAVMIDEMFLRMLCQQ